VGTLQLFLYSIYELYSSSLCSRLKLTYRNFFSEILLEFPQALTKSAMGLALDEGTKNDVSEVDDAISARRQSSHENAYRALASSYFSVFRRL
jgi:hypothetical protein